MLCPAGLDSDAESPAGMLLPINTPKTWVENGLAIRKQLSHAEVPLDLPNAVIRSEVDIEPSLPDRP